MVTKPAAITCVAQLRQLCAAHAQGTRVVQVDTAEPDWSVVDGHLRNRVADYFSIGAYQSQAGDTFILMTQAEPALVMLLVAHVGQVPAVLLLLRTEPGLIGQTNLSTTIQSTPSNYQRRHGGKATPFIDIALNPQAFGTPVQAFEDHDWGDYYIQKTKRFLIVKLDQAPPAPPGYCWVDLATAQQLLNEDHLITNDLRICLSRYLDTPGQPSSEDWLKQPDPGNEAPLVQVPLCPDVADARGVRVVSFKTEAPTREVTSWAQPLLVPGEGLQIRLVSARQGARQVFAVRRGTQPGLLGRLLWFPADVAVAGNSRHVQTSAEGGRFWRHVIGLSWLDSSGDVPHDGTDAEVIWLTREKMASLMSTEMITSLELRLVWSLVVGAA